MHALLHLDAVLSVKPLVDQSLTRIQAIDYFAGIVLVRSCENYHFKVLRSLLQEILNVRPHIDSCLENNSVG